jgi:hypothetical protein
MRKFVAGFIILLVASVLFLGRGYSANDWTDNPIVIDATEDNSFSGIIQIIEWHPDSTSDDLDIQDAGGGQLILTKAPALGDYTNDHYSAKVERVFNPPRPTVGIYVKVIDSGKVYIHLYKTRN